MLEEDLKSSGTRVIDSFVLELGPLEDQLVLLTAEPSLHLRGIPLMFIILPLSCVSL